MALQFLKHRESLRWYVIVFLLHLFIKPCNAQVSDDVKLYSGEFKVQKVEKIKGSKRYYLLTTTRSDSTFLVYSKKNKTIWCRSRLRKGDIIFLQLVPQIILDENYFIFHPSPYYYLENKHKIELSEQVHHQLYFAKNLNGDYLDKFKQSK